MPVIPFYPVTQDELYGSGNWGSVANPKVDAEETRRRSTVLQSDGTPFIVELPRYKMGFDLRVSK